MLKAFANLTDAFFSSTATWVRKLWLEKKLIYPFSRVSSGPNFNVNGEIVWAQGADLFIKDKK